MFQVGGEIMFATDDWFAVAENVLKVISSFISTRGKLIS